MPPLFLKKLLIRSGLARLLPQVRRLTAGGEDFLHYYSNRLLSAPHAELLRVQELLDRHTPDGIDLALGTPRFEPQPSLNARLPADRRGFPPMHGLPELREAVAAHLWSDQQLLVRPLDEVLITHGATGAFTTLLDTFVNPGDKVVLFDPCSPLYSLALRHRRARLHWLATHNEGGRLRFRLDQLARSLHGAKLIVVSNPNNPTGGLLAPEDLEQIAWWAHYHDALIVNDTVFSRFHDAEELRGLASLSRSQKRTLTLGSVSKSHALAAARVGWLAGERHLVAACAMTAALHSSFVPTLCQQLALNALTGDQGKWAPLHTELAARRRYALDRLQAMGLHPAPAQGGFFFWVSVASLGLTGQHCASELLQRERVWVWPGEFFGPSGTQHIRLSCVLEEGRLREGLSRLAHFVRQCRGEDTISIGPQPQADLAAAA